MIPARLRPMRPSSATLRALCAAVLLSWLPSAAPAATLYGLIDTGELFSSADGGVSWSPVSTLPVRDAVALAARLSASDLFLASRSGSIYRSMDAGANWAGVGAITASDLEDLAIRPDGVLLALTATGSLYASADLGASFTPQAALTGSNFVSLTYTTPAVKYYALTRTGEVYESLDGGASWIAKSAFIASNAVRLRAVQSSLYALAETGDVWKSDDGAASWTAVGTLSQVGMRGLARNGAALAAASREGHVATSADGAAWTWQGTMNQLTLTALASNEPATTDVGREPEAAISMGAPFPNPSAGALSLSIRLSRGTEISLALHDVSGRLVTRRTQGALTAGPHVLAWNPGGLRSGL